MVIDNLQPTTSQHRRCVLGSRGTHLREREHQKSQIHQREQDGQSLTGHERSSVIHLNLHPHDHYFARNAGRCAEPSMRRRTICSRDVAALGLVVDGNRPDSADLFGGLLCLAGVLVIMYWPRR
jgi:hypothetical protein